MTAQKTVKICGVTRPADVALAADLGADFLGLNFYPGSPRCVTVAQARELIAAAAGSPVRWVGVYVNRPVAEGLALQEELGLDLVQLHGDEGPAQVARYGGRAIKVFRRACSPRPPAPRVLAAYAAAWGFLFDVPAAAGVYGGTGESWDYRQLAGFETPGQPRWVAGGVGPTNAAEALAASGADGIDVCSRIESAPGVKDPSQMRALFAALREPTGNLPTLHEVKV